MSYAPGHDGPPVSELPYLTDRTGCTCEYACVDHYYAERWDDPDDGGDQWIISCECGSYREGDQ